MSKLLTVMATVEAVSGLALLMCPSLLVVLLIGAVMDTPAGLVVARVAGAAFIALGIVCWSARNDAKVQAVRGLLSAMLIYNSGTVAVFFFMRTKCWGFPVSVLGQRFIPGQAWRVVRSAIAPSWEDLGRLAAIALIRDFLNFFLTRPRRGSE